MWVTYEENENILDRRNLPSSRNLTTTIKMCSTTRKWENDDDQGKKI